MSLPRLNNSGLCLPTACHTAAGRGGQEEGGEQQQWTRYKFSAAAELEEHRLQPAAVYGRWQC